jgi:hypothetical protein
MLGYGVKRILIFLWLLFIPTQLGLHFWPEWSHVMGLRVDYLSPTLYFLDILWIIMVVLGGHIGPPLHWIKKRGWIVIAFVLINIFVAQNHWVAIIKWLRIFQWLITFNLILNNKKIFKEMLFKVLPFWIIGESLLAVAQVINGGSLNGIFYWLGERRFSYASIGMAQISYFGEGMIRAYGTFSHPNSMAGFLLVSLILWIKTLPLPPPLTGWGLKFNRIFYWFVVWCGMLGIVLSGSRTVWIISVVLFLYQIYKFWNKGGYGNPPVHKILGSVLILIGMLFLTLSLISNNYRISDFVGGWDSDGLAKRGSLMISSFKIIKDNPLFGVGANNFLVTLPEYQKNSGVFWLQPVHNIFILIFTEFGLVGFIILIVMLGRYSKLPLHKNMSWVVLGIILVTGMVDHYWLTLPQNWWLLCIVFSII